MPRHQHQPGEEPPVAPAQIRGAYALPATYGATCIVLQVRSEKWLHAWWTINDNDFKRAGFALGGINGAARVILRVHNLGSHGPSPTEAMPWWYVAVNPGAGRWFFQVPSADCRYKVEIGLLGDSGGFEPMASSNIARTPRIHPGSSRARLNLSWSGSLNISRQGVIRNE